MSLRRALVSIAALLWSALALAGVDVNTASVEELDRLPGIGPTKAEAIVRYRIENGPFASVDALDAVPGIGPATLASIRELVEVGPATVATAPAPEPEEAASPAPRTPLPTATARLDVNAATAEELAALPGIGATKAAAIVADRERNGPYSSCQDLTRVTGIGSATVSVIAERCTAGAP